jgi:hypothetical protein
VIRYCECRTHADGDRTCGRQASVKVTLRTCIGIQGPFFYCADCAGGLANPNNPSDTPVVKIEKLVDPNAPTDPAPAICSKCGGFMATDEREGCTLVSCLISGPRPPIEDVIARSSLGTPEAVAARLAADERAVERALARAEELDAELREDDNEEPV